MTRGNYEQDAVVAVDLKFRSMTNAALVRIGLWMSPLVAGLLALQLGKSAGYDFRFYHYFNGYAFMTGRPTPDILPAGAHTFLNPVADGLLYGLIENFPARFSGFILGAIHSLNFVVAVIVASCVLAFPRTGAAAFVPVLLTVAGSLGVTSLDLLGSYHHDNIVSIFFLVSLLIVCRQAQTSGPAYAARMSWQAVAGASVGLGLGLKLTLAPFVLAIGCAPLFYPWPVRRRLEAMAISALAGLAGLLAVAGPHMWNMYTQFGNPLFPFFQWLSRPPFDEFVETRDLRFVPGTLLEYLFYPLYFPFDPYRTNSFPFRDFRLPITYAVALIFLAVLFGRWWKRREDGVQGRAIWRISPQATVLLGVATISYLGWLFLFGIYRYLLPIELLSFVILALLLFDILGQKRGAIALAVLAVLIIPTTYFSSDERRPWGDQRYVETKLPSVPQVRPDAMALVGGANAGSYFIPEFPLSVRFFGVDVINDYVPYAGENRGSPAPASMLGPFKERMDQAISEHTGQILGIFRASDTKRARHAFLVYGLIFTLESCGTITSNVASGDPLYLCELSRKSAA